jgi:hypothetical protein
MGLLWLMLIGLRRRQQPPPSNIGTADRRSAVRGLHVARLKPPRSRWHSRDVPSTEYWNHNTAYHPWLVDLAARLGGEVLDVGGGDGLLAQRLAPVSRAVTVLEPDPAAADRADDRSLANVDVVRQTFDDFESGPAIRPRHLCRQPASHEYPRGADQGPQPTDTVG